MIVGGEVDLGRARGRKRREIAVAGLLSFGLRTGCTRSRSQARAQSQAQWPETVTPIGIGVSRIATRASNSVRRSSSGSGEADTLESVLSQIGCADPRPRRYLVTCLHRVHTNCGGPICGGALQLNTHAQQIQATSESHGDAGRAAVTDASRCNCVGACREHA
eukprot:g20544.t1